MTIRKNEIIVDKAVWNAPLHLFCPSSQYRRARWTGGQDAEVKYAEHNEISGEWQAGVIREDRPQAAFLPCKSH
jgi:hypothetical protein